MVFKIMAEKNISEQIRLRSYGSLILKIAQRNVQVQQSYWLCHVANQIA